MITLNNLPKWESYDTETDEEWLQNLPKIELHVHLDGSFDPNILWNEMAKLKENHQELTCLPVSTPLPWDNHRPLFVRKLVTDCQTPKEYHALCCCRGQKSLYQMFQCFEIFLPLVRGNLQLLELLAFDFCQRQAEQNVVYTEVRYSPQLLAKGAAMDSSSSENDDDDNNNSSDAWEVLNAITKGLQRGSQEFGIVVNQILCAINWRPDWAMQVLDMAVAHQHDALCPVVGVDIAAGEEHFDTEAFSHREMMLRAQELGLRITIHAGETGETSVPHILQAIHDYGATRIGHGYSMTLDPAVMEQVRQGDVHVEVCPTSSVETGGWSNCDDASGGTNWKEHPCRVMHKHGVSFSFSSDDPAVFNTSLSWQYRLAIGRMGFSREQVLKTNRDAVEAAFISRDEKNRLLKMLDDYNNVGTNSSSISGFSSRSTSFNDRVREDDDRSGYASSRSNSLQESEEEVDVGSAVES